MLSGAIARGGTGVAYRGRQISLNRPVALKACADLRGRGSARLDADRFRRRGRIALLDHPNIVTIYEVGEIAGCHYFSMKLFEGGSLASHLERFAADPIVSVRLLAQGKPRPYTTLTSAGAPPRSQTIEHPARHRGTATCRRLLMGDSIEGSGEQTASEAILGSPSYMAPEGAACGRKSITVATDVYGSARFFTCVLTGRAPLSSLTRCWKSSRKSRLRPRIPSRVRALVLTAIWRPSA